MVNVHHARALLVLTLLLLLTGSGRPAAAEVMSCATAKSVYEDALAAHRARHGVDAAPPPSVPAARPAPGGDPGADALVQEAIGLRNASQYDDALAKLDDAEAIYKRQERQAAVAYVHYQRGVIRSRQRQREAALAELGAALSLYRGLPQPDLRGIAEVLIARSALERGLSRFTDALATSKELTEVIAADPAADPADAAEALFNTGATYSRLGAYRDALAAFEAMRAFANKNIGRRSAMAAKAHHNVGTVNRTLKNFAAAFDSLAEARAILELQSPPRPIPLAEALEDAAKTYTNLKCLDEPVRLGEEAVQLYVSATHAFSDRVANAKHRLGLAFREAGRNEEAIVPLVDAALIYDANLGPGNLRSAEAETDLATVYARLGRFDEAGAAALSAITAAEARMADGLETLRQAYWAQATIQKRAKNAPAAIVYAKLAVNTQQSIRARNAALPKEQRGAYSARYRELYDFLAESLIDQGRLQEAQFALDLVKQEEIFRFVRGEKAEDDGEEAVSLSPAETAMTEAILKELRNVSAIDAGAELIELNALAKKGALPADKLARLRALKRAKFENFEKAMKEAKMLTTAAEASDGEIGREVTEMQIELLGQMRRKLKQFDGRAVMLQAASFEDSLHLFVTSSVAPVHREVRVSRKELRRLAFKAWSGVARQDAEADAALKQLYFFLIAPVAADLKASGAEVIMLNLSGFLRYVPFAALNNGERYLIEDYALALYTPAADTRYERIDRDPARSAGFGVTEALRDFSGLPGVAEELKSIFGAPGPLRGTSLLNADFNAETLAAALEEEPQFVHIASHFKLTPGDETKSFLLLGNGEELTLDRFRSDAGLQFDSVDLLTLSACETAGEVGSEGEEVESFATLAQGSGASSVMATLWPISDASTAKLMADFYDGLLSGGLDKALALRRAQVAMLRNLAAADVPPARRGALLIDDGEAPAAQEPGVRHPYYWASFVLMGNWL